MSLTYTASVFYGTYVPRKSEIGKRIHRFIERQGGTQARTDTPRVVLDLVGSDIDLIIAILAEGSDCAIAMRGEIGDPQPLIGRRAWEARIDEFLQVERISRTDLPRVGWWFAGSVF